MRSIFTVSCTFALLALGGCASAPMGPVAASAAPATAVEFVQAEHFTDVGDRRDSTPRMRAYYLNQLRNYMERTAARLLPAGQHLDVQVTDVDMAGAFEPWRTRASDARIVRDIYPPRIDLQFRLSGADGTTIREGTRQLRNMAFLTTAAMSVGSDELHYEKALLLDWMQSEFGRTH